MKLLPELPVRGNVMSGGEFLSRHFTVTQAVFCLSYKSQLFMN
jgi:hypothetical protein